MIEIILFIIGTFLLIKGADLLVDGSSSLAKKLGIPTLVIGLTVVAFGTSMPELVVNIIAAVNHKGDIAFGNIVGSNLANILLILGVAAVITTLKVQHSTVWKEIPFAFLAVLVLFVFANVSRLDGLEVTSLLRMEGIVLLLFFAIFMVYVIELALKNKDNMIDDNLTITKHSSWGMYAMIGGGLLGLYFGGRWTVEGAVFIAKYFGLSEFFISATIIAIGTSLPELVTTITAARKGDIDLAVGNVVGSNIFNIFLVLGITAIINPVAFPSTATLDLLVLVAATFLLFAFMFLGKKHQLERWQGASFLALYVGYIVFLFMRG